MDSNIYYPSHPLHLIVAMGEDGSIGCKGDLIWKISDDLKHFKSLTIGHPVIMGRKTWESLPKRPLPSRRNIIVTRQKDFKADGADIVNSIFEALQLVKDDEAFVIGGEEIYNSFMPYISIFHITKVFDSCPDADAHLFLPSNLQTINSSEIKNSPTSPPFQFLTFSLPQS